MKNLKEEKRDILSWQIAQIVNKDYPPISNDNINELVKRMALVNRLGNLLQEYMMLDYNYKNGLISFEMVDRMADGVVQPCYVPATNVVRLDADLIKLYTMEDILVTLLHELRHKWQLDQVDYAVQIPHYERYSPKTEKEFDMLWSMEKDELDADNFAYFYSKKILRGKPKNKNHSKVYKFKLVNPVKGTFNYLKGNLKFAFLKRTLDKNPDLNNQVILHKAKRDLSDKRSEILVCDKDKHYAISLSALEKLAVSSSNIQGLCEKFSKIKPSLREVDLDKLIEIDYTRPSCSPIEVESLILYLYDYQEEILGAGICLSMYNYFFRYAMEELDPSPDIRVLNEYMVDTLTRSLKKGLVISSQDELFELGEDILEARKRIVRCNLDAENAGEQIL